MLKEIRICNFKQFDEFSVKRFSPVTLIGGKNNTGKSSLLEAIYFCYSQMDDVFFRLNRIRRLSSGVLTPAELWEHYFYMHDVDRHRINISWTDDHEKFEVSCGKSLSSDEQVTEEINVRHDPPRADRLDDLTTISRNYPISLQVRRNGQSELQEECTLRIESDVQINGQKKIKKSMQEQRAKWGIQFLSAHFSYGSLDVINAFGRIELDNRKDEVIKAAQFIDSRIKDISTIITGGQTGRLYATIQQEDGEIRKIPLQSMGDGINRLLVMITTVLATPNGIVLIDEMENGLHFSMHEILWELLIRAANAVQAQIIATTHSEACIDGAFHAMEKLKSQPNFDFGEDEFTYIRMAKNGASIQARGFDQETYSYAVKTGIELR